MTQLCAAWRAIREHLLVRASAGLPAAGARLVRGLPISVTLEVNESAMPDDIATTAYFVISEALANAA